MKPIRFFLKRLVYCLCLMIAALQFFASNSMATSCTGELSPLSNSVIAHSISTSQDSRALPYWNFEYQKFLTYKLTPEQIAEMQTISNPEEYQKWLNRYLAEGWTAFHFLSPETHKYLFKAFQTQSITLHEFMTGMLFAAAKTEIGSTALDWITSLTEANMEEFLNRILVPLKPDQREEFKSRVKKLHPRERVYFRISRWKPTSFLTHFGIKAMQSSSDSSYRLIPPVGTKTQLLESRLVRDYSVTVLSSSLRQILSDVMYGEDSVQYVPVIGNENSFDMGNLFAMGGRSVATAFPGVRVHFPHNTDPHQKPLTVLLHDYYHNERVSRTPRETRTQVIPYLLQLIQKSKGRQWASLPFPFSFDGVNNPTLEPADLKDLKVHNINVFLKFAGAQDSAEELTDHEEFPWKMEKYLNALSLDMNAHLEPESNHNYRFEKYCVAGIILQDILANPQQWAKFGYSQEWLNQFLSTEASYRLRYLFSLVQSGAFTAAQRP